MAPICKSMNGGEGPLSYVKNSSYQRAILDVAKPIIQDEISAKLNIQQLCPTSRNMFCVADFGCSTGHNSFPAIEFIIQAIKQNHQDRTSTGFLISSTTPEFFVFFNDLVVNDFNTLFSSLPPKSTYHASGVPGDFHGRLLPKSSLHFAYSSWSLHWLAEVPKEVEDSGSPAWNKGEILYKDDRKEVCRAYLDQYTKDIEAFLEARAVEMVAGGLMALLIPASPDSWNPETEFIIPCELNLMGSCLVDMVKKGRLSEAQVDSFNLPVYFTTPQQLKTILLRSKSFIIERLEILDNPGKHIFPRVEDRIPFYRAILENLLTGHFGNGIIDEFFHLYMKKFEASPIFLNPDNDKSIVLLVILKRKIDYH